MGWEFLVLLVVGPLVVGLLISAVVKERERSAREEEEHHILGRFPL
jgi:hypothetical protein